MASSEKTLRLARSSVTRSFRCHVPTENALRYRVPDPGVGSE
jgi:hypothetical protein